MLRRQSGLSQRTFAKTVGISPSYLGKLECGRGMPSVSLDILSTIANGFNISLSELLQLDEHAYHLGHLFLHDREERLQRRLRQNAFSAYQ